MKPLRTFAALNGFFSRLYFILGAGFIFLLLSMMPAHADDAVLPLVQDVILVATSDSSTATVVSESSVLTATQFGQSQQSSQQQTTQDLTIEITSSIPSTTSVETKIHDATVTLSTAVESATATLQTIPNVQQVVESNTVATQAVNSASSCINTATTAIAAAESATATAVVAQQAVDSQTAVVATATNLVVTSQATVDSATALVDSQTVVVATDTANVALAQSVADSSTVTTTTNGVTATVYYGSGRSPALPASNATPILTTTVPQIAFNWGSGSVMGGPSERVIVKFEGTITVPDEAVAVKYAVSSDDGSMMYIDGQLAISNWRDQGTAWSQYSPTYNTTVDKQQDFVIWYYETGGGATCTLGWLIWRADGSG